MFQSIHAYEIQVLLIESKFCLNHVGNEDNFLLTMGMNCGAKDQVSELYPVVSSASSLSAMFETL